MKDEVYKDLPIRWINTPMSYAKLTTKYNLFQQAVLLKVSEHLQRQIEIYYGTDLSKSKDIPRPLFSDEQKQMGLGKIYVSYAELGVSANSFPKVREEARQCLEKMVVPGPIIMKNGKPTQSLYPVFSEVHIDQDTSTCSFELNTKIIDEVKRLSVLDYTFDMSKKYVKHPDNIAIIGKVEKMPGLYFLLRDAMQSWKYKKAKLTVKDIKDFLNMIEKDENGVVTKEMYPKFSQFKKHCLEPALSDIQRLKEMGQIDVCFDMELIYNSKRHVGNPAFIIFTINEDKLKNKPQQTSLFPDNNSLTTGEGRGGASWLDQYANPTKRVGQQAWESMCAECATEEARNTFSNLKVEKIENKKIVLYGNKEKVDDVENMLQKSGKAGKAWFFNKLSQFSQMQICGIIYHITEK